MLKSKDVNSSFRTVAGGLNTSGLGIAIKPKVNVLKAPQMSEQDYKAKVDKVRTEYDSKLDELSVLL